MKEIGLGAWGFSGDAYGPIKIEEALDVLRSAIDHKVRFIDTSDSYGQGRSERVIGNFISSKYIKRDELIIATKGGLLPHKTFHMPCDFSKDYISSCIEGSLNRLNTDYIDVYQLHSPDVKDVIENDKLLKMLEKKKNDGTIRNIGISARSPEDAAKLLKVYPFDSVQVNYNIIDHRLDDELKKGGDNWKSKFIIARTPFAFGYLTGNLNDNMSSLSEDDHRKKWPVSQVRLWLNALEKFNDFNLKYQLTPIETALLYCLSNVNISMVIPGMMSVQQVVENTKVLERDLFTDEQLYEINEIYESIDWFIPGVKKD
jgi:aryl-alcohol dehydrogenase-like predicted oxidoreductase